MSGVAPLSNPVGHLSITSMGLCPALLRCLTLWATSVSPVRVCVRRRSAVLSCGSPQYHKYGPVSGLLRCLTLWATSVSSVWVCVRRCSAVLPCGSPRYHKYGSVSGAAPLSYPVGHLSITNMGLCPALLRCPTLWVTSVSQVWVCAGAAPLSYPVGHLSITSMGLCTALLRKLQALVYDILPSTTAVFSYVIGSRKLSANEQFVFCFLFCCCCWCSYSSKFVTNNSNKTRRVIYSRQQSLLQHK